MLSLRVVVTINGVEIDLSRVPKWSKPTAEARGRHPSGGGVVTEIDSARSHDQRRALGRGIEPPRGIAPPTESLVGSLRGPVTLALHVATVSGAVAYRLLAHVSLLVLATPPAVGTVGDHADDEPFDGAEDTASVVRALHPYYRANKSAINPQGGRDNV